MAERGLEFRVTPGFGWIKGDVKAIEPRDPALKIPHMGWNTLNERRRHPLFEGIALGSDGLHGYFVHSYHLNTNKDPFLLKGIVLKTTPNDHFLIEQWKLVRWQGDRWHQFGKLYNHAR